MCRQNKIKDKVITGVKKGISRIQSENNVCKRRWKEGSRIKTERMRKQRNKPTR
jgi:hypothetical protein